MKVTVITPIGPRDTDLHARAVVDGLALDNEIEHILVFDGNGKEQRAAALPTSISGFIHRKAFPSVGNGVSDARNTALTVATGDIIAFLDADDLWPRDYICTLNQLFSRRPEVHAVSAYGLEIPGSELIDRPVNSILVRERISHNDVCVNCVGCPSGFSFRQTQDNAGLRFLSGVRYCEDHDFYVRLFGRSRGKWVRTLDTFYLYRRSAGQVTVTASQSDRDASRAKILTTTAKSRGELSSKYARMLFSLQVQRLTRGDGRWVVTAALAILRPSWALLAIGKQVFARGLARRLIGVI